MVCGAAVVVAVLITERLLGRALINQMVVTAAMVTELLLITERVLINPMVVVATAMVTVLVMVLVIINQSLLPVVSLLNQPVLPLLGLRHKKSAQRKIPRCAIKWIFAQTVRTTKTINTA